MGKSFSTSNQTTVTKDNSAIVEDSAINVTDGASVVKENAVVNTGNENDQISGNSIGAGGDLRFDGSIVSIETLDGQTIDNAAAIVDNSNARIADTLSEVIGFASQSQESSLQAVDRAQGAYAEFIDDKTEDAASAVQETIQSTFVKLGAIGGVILLGIIFLRKPAK